MENEHQALTPTHTHTHTHIQGCKLRNTDSMKLACDIFGLDAASFGHALCFRLMVTRDETFEVPQNVLQARVARDAVAKTMYSRLFDWLGGGFLTLFFKFYFFFSKENFSNTRLFLLHMHV